MDFSPRLSIAISVPLSLREKVPVRADEGALSLEFPLTQQNRDCPRMGAVPGFCGGNHCGSSWLVNSWDSPR